MVLSFIYLMSGAREAGHIATRGGCPLRMQKLLLHLLRVHLSSLDLLLRRDPVFVHLIVVVRLVPVHLHVGQVPQS